MSSENPAAKHGVEFDVDTRSVMHVQAQTLRELRRKLLRQQNRALALRISEVRREWTDIQERLSRSEQQRRCADDTSAAILHAWNALLSDLNAVAAALPVPHGAAGGAAAAAAAGGARVAVVGDAERPRLQRSAGGDGGEPAAKRAKTAAAAAGGGGGSAEAGGDDDDADAVDANLLRELQSRADAARTVMERIVAAYDGLRAGGGGVGASVAITAVHDNAALNDRLSALRTRLSALVETNSKLSESIDTLNEALDNERRRAVRLETQVVTLRVAVQAAGGATAAAGGSAAGAQAPLAAAAGAAATTTTAADAASLTTSGATAAAPGAALSGSSQSLAASGTGASTGAAAPNAEELNNRIGELERAVAAAQAIAEARALEITALRNKVADAERTSYETIATANVKARNAVMSEGTVSRSELDSAMTEIASKTALLAAETARQQQSATEFSEAMKKVAVADGEHASKLADVMRESERLAESLQQRLAEAEAKRRKQKQDEALQKSIDLPSMREMVADLNKRIASQSAELKTLRAELLQRAEAAVSSGERTAAEAAALAASPAAAALLQRAADDIRALTTSTSSLMAELTEICQSLDSTEAQADRATRLMSEKELANLSLMERNQRESNKTIMAQEQLKALQEEKRVARLASDARAELEKAVQAERARIDVFKKMADDELAALGALAAEARARIADADRARAAAQRQTSSVTADLEALKAANAQLVERERQLSKERAELHEAKVAAEAAKESAERKMQTLRTALSGGGRGLKHYYDRLMCRVCKKQEISAVISLCYHAFCLDCLEQNVRDRSRKCPGCGLHFGQNDIKSIFF